MLTFSSKTHEKTLALPSLVALVGVIISVPVWAQSQDFHVPKTAKPYILIHVKSEIKGTHYHWLAFQTTGQEVEIVPYANENQAILTGKPGKYIIVCLVLQNQLLVKQQAPLEILSDHDPVDPSEPNRTPIEKISYQQAIQCPGFSKDKSQRLADALRAISAAISAGAFSSISELQAATKRRLNSIVDSDQWEPWNSAVSTAIMDEYNAKRLESEQPGPQWKSLYDQLAKGLEDAS